MYLGEEALTLFEQLAGHGRHGAEARSKTGIERAADLAKEQRVGTEREMTLRTSVARATHASYHMPEITAIITALIIERPMCPDCIAMKAGRRPCHGRSQSRAIKNVLTLRRDETGRRRVCGTIGIVLSLIQP